MATKNLQIRATSLIVQTVRGVATQCNVVLWLIKPRELLDAYSADQM